MKKLFILMLFLPLLSWAANPSYQSFSTNDFVVGNPAVAPSIWSRRTNFVYQLALTNSGPDVSYVTNGNGIFAFVNTNSFGGGGSGNISGGTFSNVTLKTSSVVGTFAGIGTLTNSSLYGNSYFESISPLPPGVLNINLGSGILSGSSVNVGAVTASVFNGGSFYGDGNHLTNLTSGSSILSGNGSGGFSSVAIGTGLTYSGGTLAATGTSVSSNYVSQVFYTNAGPLDTYPLTNGGVISYYLKTNGFGGSSFIPTITNFVTFIIYTNTTTITYSTNSSGQITALLGTNNFGGAVNYVRGDGTVLDSTIQVGNVWLGLKTQPANTVFGNNTGSVGAPGFISSLPAMDASSVLNLNASQLASGTVPRGRLATNSPVDGQVLSATGDKNKWITTSGSVSINTNSNPLSSTIGTGFFYPTKAISAGISSMQDSVAGSFSTSGLIDVIETEAGSNNRFLPLTNNGAGYFSTTAIAMTGNGYGIVAADFNLDGKLDLAIESATGIQVFTNNGKAVFTSIGTYVGYSIPRALAAGDFNGDGWPDLAVAPTASIGMITLTNNHAGSFIESFTNPIVAFSPTLTRVIADGDFNKDGIDDLAVLTAVSGTPALEIFTNTGTAGVPSLCSSNYFPEMIGSNGKFVVYDFNGDGWPDIAYSRKSGTGTVGFYTNNQSGGLGFFSSYNTTTATPALAGFTPMPGYQYPVCYVGDNAGAMVFLTNNGSAYFPVWTNFSFGNVELPLIADYNNDGIPDIFDVSAASGGSLNYGASIVTGLLTGNGGAISNIFTLASGTSSSLVWGSNSGVTNTTAGKLTINTNFQPFTAAGNFFYSGQTYFASAATSGTVTPTPAFPFSTVYLNSGSTIASITIALPTSSTTAGQVFYIHSKSAVTTLTVTGGGTFIDAAVTSMTAGQTLGFMATTTGGNYLRLQ